MRVRPARGSSSSALRHASAHHGARGSSSSALRHASAHHGARRFATGMLENAMIEFDVNESYPMVLSLWHEELRKDVIVRA